MNVKRLPIWASSLFGLISVLIAASPVFAAANVSGLPNSSPVSLTGDGALRGQFQITSERWDSTYLYLDGWVYDRKADDRTVKMEISVSYAYDPRFVSGKTYSDTTSSSGATAIPGEYKVYKRGGIASSYALDYVRVKIWTDGGPFRNDWSLTKTYSVSGA